MSIEELNQQSQAIADLFVEQQQRHVGSLPGSINPAEGMHVEEQERYSALGSVALNHPHAA
jgi:hypothetical protein